MIVTIVRHGEAGLAATDAERTLTATGHEDVVRAGHRLGEIYAQKGIPQPDSLAHSAWTRTTQTAALLSAAFPHARMTTEIALLPGALVDGVTGALSRFQEAATEHVMLVSHQPLVSNLVDEYLGHPHPTPGLSPGGVVTIDMPVVERHCGQLLFWSLPPVYEAGL